MLGKLLKYEFKATGRLFLPLYLAIIVFALITRFLSPFKVLATGRFSFDIQVILSVLSITAYIILIVGVLTMTVIIMIQRFYKSLLGDEGYLMFTLPVKSWTHIVSKLVVAMVWTTLSFFVTVGSVLIIAEASNLPEHLAVMVDSFRDTFGTAGFFVMPGNITLSLASSILMVYAAIALGHLFTKHKLIASFAMYCVLYIISQVIYTIVLIPFVIPFLRNMEDAMAPTAAQLNFLIFWLTLPVIILTIGYYILTNVILQKKLNLE